jgi:hypothetical protein
MKLRREVEVKLSKPTKGVELRDDEEDGIDRIAYYVAGVNNVIYQVMKLGAAYMVLDTARQVIVKRMSNH